MIIAPLRNFLLLTASVGMCADSAGQITFSGDGWGHSPGGGIALNAQSSTGLEVSGNFLWAHCIGGDDDHVYLAGPELSIGGYLSNPSSWGQRIGLRQMFLVNGAVGATTSLALENYSTGLSLEDTRWSVHAGPTILGVLSVEYGRSFALTQAPQLVSTEQIMFRLTVNPITLEKALDRFPPM